MAVTYTNNWPVAFLRASLRATYSPGYTFANGAWLRALDSSGVSQANAWQPATNGSEFSTPSGAYTAMTVPKLMTGSTALTIGRLRMDLPSLGSALYMTGVSTTSGECVFDTLTPSGGGDLNVTKFGMGFSTARDTVKVSTTLLNAWLSILVGKTTSHISANGTIKVYSGTAPASADDAATGTELWSVNVDTTSSFTWNDVTANNCTLASNLVATSAAFGSNQTVGYARFSWTHNAVTYVIQGSVGEGTGDFRFSNLDGAGNDEMVQNTSYTMNNATIGF